MRLQHVWGTSYTLFYHHRFFVKNLEYLRVKICMHIYSGLRRKLGKNNDHFCVIGKTKSSTLFRIKQNFN